MPMTEKKQEVAAHLKPYVVEQHYNQYTPINQAVWRFVMRQNMNFLEGRAHPAFLEGLKSSGIQVESLPRVEEMNASLRPFGWGAVTIDGLIPGVAFFDFQAHGLLPIATDIRTLDHIAYTPTPDIIHEAAGHAPILCDEKYAEYVKLFGEIGAKALASKEEHEAFEATRHLSQLMENPSSTEEEIAEAHFHLTQKQQQIDGVSEAEQISRLYWWTVEYGLIGKVDQPLIYGAGLLSSVGESKHCLSEKVTKHPFTLDACINTGFDVTRPQPQLFVCHDFDQLIAAVKEFAERMAFKVGGTESLNKALLSHNTATMEYSSGLQVSGTLTDVVLDTQGEAVYMKTSGPTALAVDGHELAGHGKSTHQDGFGAPIGRVIGLNKPLELADDQELKQLGVQSGQWVTLTFHSGVEVEGRVLSIRREAGKLVLISFTECRVQFEEQLLFAPEWGDFDMAVGERITSVFAGAADRERFFANIEREEIVFQPVTDSSQDREWSSLEKLYDEVRSIREGRSQEGMKGLQVIHERLQIEHPQDWLLRVEILELLVQANVAPQWVEQVEKELDELIRVDDENGWLIQNGVVLAKKGS
ncbi:aromatic amino acid hydroxylase [Mechercharimyces sp. CAU 1602]|uniref:aromatic amino acid hydroxylase n=1 Tax=Mechercharimyces sp. CAU 1602 TaxID=2973933 RepID=UPI002162A988|nr:aromatic amino acid hydroxylase [Mechercharimyces sp. CAU 1602]MCS1351842.1 aromatic amino acid hydroxylase [Mechercharimyces sp. CAU 1602]